MAKSLRASKSKTNKSHLRTKIHQPVEDARTERLAAKLLELAQKPKETTKPDADMPESTAQADQNTTEENPAPETGVEKMDIDRKTVKSKSRSRDVKVQKRRAKVVFAVGKQHGKRRSGRGYQGPGVR